MARTIAIAMSKGGSAKTTTTTNLAHKLALDGYRVLAADCDTQGQLSITLGTFPALGLAELVTGEAEADDCLVQARERLFLLSGGRALAAVKRMIDRKDLGPERTLAEALAPIRDRFDFVLLDTGPGWDAMSVNALFAADEVLCPVNLERLGLEGLRQFAKNLAPIQKYNRGLRLAFVLPTLYDRRVKKSDRLLAELRERYPEVLCSPIRYSVKLSECVDKGRTIFEHSSESSGAEDYAELAARVRNAKV